MTLAARWRRHAQPGDGRARAGPRGVGDAPAGYEGAVTLVERVLPRRPFDSLRDYLDAGGGQGIDSARGVEPDAVMAEVEASGLRGRGGAGFPTGTKWRTVAGNLSPDLPTTVVVNFPCATYGRSIQFNEMFGSMPSRGVSSTRPRNVLVFLLPS